MGDRVAFALYRGIDNNGKGTICSTIRYQIKAKVNNPDGDYLNSTKYFQKGLPRGLSVLVDHNVPVKHIVVSESPIDALSYKQLHKIPAGVMYVSTCGSLSEGVKKELENVFSNAKEHRQSVTLVFDNDKAGRQMNKMVSDIAHAHQVICKSSIPSKDKDWNQELVASLGKQEMLRKL